MLSALLTHCFDHCACVHASCHLCPIPVNSTVCLAAQKQKTYVAACDSWSRMCNTTTVCSPGHLPSAAACSELAALDAASAVASVRLAHRLHEFLCAREIAGSAIARPPFTTLLPCLSKPHLGQPIATCLRF